RGRHRRDRAVGAQRPQAHRDPPRPHRLRLPIVQPRARDGCGGEHPAAHAAVGEEAGPPRLPPHGRAPRTQRPTPPPSPRTLRRPAAARRRRPRTRVPAGCHRRRRTHRQPRLERRRGGAEHSAVLGRRTRPDRRHGHPRSPRRRPRRPRRAARRRPAGRGTDRPGPRIRGHRADEPHRDHRRLEHRSLTVRSLPRSDRTRRRCTLIRIAWSNLRSASGRLFAATIAIAVSVAFIVAALLFSQAFGDTLRDQVRHPWAGADVASTASRSANNDPADPAPQTDSAPPPAAGSVSAAADGTTVAPMPTHVPQNQDEPITGSAPEADDELMLHEADAQTLGLGVGDELTMQTIDGTGGSGSDDRTYTVSGIMPGSSASATALYLTDAGLQTVPSELTADSVRVVAADGTDRGDLAESVDTVVAEAGSADALTVQTVDQVVNEQLEAMSDSTNVLNTVGLAFGLLA